MRRILWILSLACIFPATGHAQQHGGAAMMSGVHFSAAPAPMGASRAAATRFTSAARPVTRTLRTSTRTTASPKSVHPISWNRVTSNNTPPFDLVYPYGNPVVNGYPVPGLGFDYSHYFAVHPNAGRCFRCFGNGFGTGYVVPFVDGGLYLPYPMYAEQPAEAAPEEGPPPEQATQAEAPAPPDNYYNYNPPTRPAPQAAPKPEAEYVFVRRDGTLIFAVAYSWINDRLQYVTEEGLRRTVPVNTLDLDATQQFNDQRGVPIRFPA